jgi:hypothetical protein
MMVVMKAAQMAASMADQLAEWMGAMRVARRAVSKAG